jgi:ubiquinone/menaquinone biosynthesis C-methylase UbiE
MKRSLGVIGDALWERTDCFKSLPDMASAKASRMIMADLIRYSLGKQESTATIFSMGIGLGDMYKTLLKKEIESEKLRVYGIDCDDQMIERCVEDFPGNYMESSTFINVTDNCSSVHKKSVARNFEIYESSMDFVEARFILHNVLLKRQIHSILTKIYTILKPGAMLMMSDIDFWIGSYIEKKLIALSNYYHEVWLDEDNTLILCKKLATVEFPILDQKNYNDNEAIKGITKLSLDGLRKEAEATGKLGWEEIAALDTLDWTTGRAWFRTKEEWEELVKNAFQGNAKIQVISPAEIKRKHTDVQNHIFMLTAIKTA